MPNDRRSLLGCVDRLLDPDVLELGIVAGERKVRGESHHLQNIIQVVRDAARQLADSLHFLRLPELALQFFQPGHVPFHRNIFLGDATGIVNRSDRRLFRIQGTVLAAIDEAALPNASGFQRPPESA